MKFVIRRYEDDYFHNEVAPAPDELRDKIVTILEHGYHFGVQDIGFASLMFVERDAEHDDVAIELIIEGEDWDPLLTRLVAKAYEIAVTEPHIALGIVPDHYDDQITAEDANLKVPFTPFDTEGTTNED